MLTNEGKKYMEEVLNNFPKLSNFYDGTLGNFMFSKKEFEDNLSDIVRWRNKCNDYFILNQEDNIFLTNFIE